MASQCQARAALRSSLIGFQGWLSLGQEEQICFQDKVSFCKQFPNQFSSWENTLPLGGTDPSCWAPHLF